MSCLPRALVVVGLALLHTLTAGASHLVNQDNVGNQQLRFSQRNVDDFTQLLVDTDRRQLLVGARDHIYQLDLDTLELKDSNEWSPSENDITSCMRKGQTARDCRNYMTLLHENNGTVYICGTNAFAPVCRTYSIDDISKVMDEENGRLKSPFSPRTNVTSVMTTQGELFVGSTIDFVGADPAFIRSGGRTQSVLRTPQYNQEYLSNPQFVNSFEVGDFVYFFFRENAIEYSSCGKNIFSRIGRVCKNDQGSLYNSKTWTTFLKGRLNCSLSGAIPFYFNEMQGVDYLPRQEMFYVTFTTGINSIYGSAVCSYSLDEINRAFKGPLTGKLHNFAKGKPSTDRFQCRKSNELMTHEEDLDVKMYQQTFEAVQSHSKPLYNSELERLTHIQVDTVLMDQTQSVDVMFVASLEGVVKKIVHKPSTNTSCVIDEVKPFRAGEKLNKLRLVREKQVLIALTSMGVVQLPLSYCDQYRTKKTCLSAGDPYCGWNHGQDKCTTAPDGNVLNPQWEQGAPCVADESVVDGGWGRWSEWNLCGLYEGVEGDGCMCRQRRCDSPAPLNGGIACYGADVQVANCTKHGGWTDWSEWSACSSPCGPGYQHRSRSCTNPRPAFGGQTCIGNEREERGCPNNPSCLPTAPVVNTKTIWGHWGEWSICSVQCGGGFQVRQRECTLLDKKDCELGCSKEYRECNTWDCPEVKGRSEWTKWMIVNQTTDGYHEKRYRYQCVARVPHAKMDLISKVDERFCRDISDCHDSASNVIQQNATWSPWSEWGPCSATCGGGYRRRQRMCESSRPELDCLGPSYEESQCNTQMCPTEGWSEWTQWSDCDSNGEQHRKRHCIAKDDYQRRCLAGVHTKESRICLHLGARLAGKGIQCAGAGGLAVTMAVVISYIFGLATMIFVVRLYNKRNRDSAMLSASSISTSLQTIPVPKRLGSLPLVPVESNTYVPTSQFKGQFNTLQSTPVKAATIKRSNTFRAQLGDDQNF